MSEINASPVPAGWYVDPSGLPQQRWWDGHQWTHDVTPMKQDLSQLPAPQFGTYSQPQAIPVRREPEPAPALALPATTTQPDAFPTRRQLRREFEEAEAARLAAEAAAEPHPAAPFAMPSADVAAAPAAATPAPAEQFMPAAAVTPPAAPVIVEPAPQPIAEPLPVAAVAFAAAVTAPVIAAPIPATPIPAAPVAPAIDLQPAPPVAASPAPVEVQPAPPVAAQPPLQFAPQVIPMPQPTPAAAWPFQSSSMQASTVAASPAAVVDPASSVPYQPFGMIPKTTSGAVVAPDKSETVAAWLIAGMPLIMVGVAVLIVTQLGDYYTRFMQGGLVFIFALVTIALAVRDNRELRAAGHLAPASPAWVLLTPLVYLSVRSSRVRKETGHGSAPLWVWLIVVAAVVAGCLLLPEWLDKIVAVTSIF